MATYNTLPTVSEDALINEPKAPQNRKAIAIVAAVCFASASVGALVQPHAARGITSFNYHNAKTIELAKYGGQPYCLGVGSHTHAGPGANIKLYPCKPNDDGQQFRLTRDTDHIKYRAPSGRYAGQQFCVTEELGKRSKPGLELDWCDETSTNQMFDYEDGKFRLRAHGGCLAPEYVDNFSPLRGVDCDDDWTRWFIN